MASFEILYAEMVDLAADDPMRPAAIVHVLGDNAKNCYDAVAAAYSIYVIGRGKLPPGVGKEGYFLAASKPDYPTLKVALADSWSDMPDFPRHSLFDIPRQIQSQEMADVINYIAKPPLHDPRIFHEARKRLRGLVPRRHLVATARVAQWLVENMAPANNCYTLAALFARWLRDHDAPAEYCTGHATLRFARRLPVTIPHAWVNVDAQVCDLTVDRQSAWRDSGRSMARIRVNSPRIVYEAGGGKHESLEEYWHLFSKPPGRPEYTRASLERQSAMIRDVVGPLFNEREPWINSVRQYGILEGTYRLLMNTLVGHD